MQKIEKNIKFYIDIECHNVYLCKVLNSNMFCIFKIKVVETIEKWS
jgi:hypothetical protein